MSTPDDPKAWHDDARPDGGAGDDASQIDDLLDDVLREADLPPVAEDDEDRDDESPSVDVAAGDVSRRRRVPNLKAPPGMRSDRLRRRKRSTTERRQVYILYVLAAAVAFAAVLGAWWLGSRLFHDSEIERAAGHLTLLTLTESDKPVAAALMVKSSTSGQYTLYVIPRELLLQGPNGEYIFAEDSMATGNIQEDVERAIGVPVDGAYSLALDSLQKLAATDVLQVNLIRPVTVIRNGTQRTYDDRMVIVADEIPELFETSGSGGYDSTTIQEGLWGAVAAAAAARPAEERALDITALSSAAQGSTDRWYLTDALTGLTAGEATVVRFPSRSRVAEGQFAFLPDAEGVMADIRRQGTVFSSQFNVIVRNGTGEVGIGEAVVERLASLNVNLPAPTNADRFDYKKTRIMAGSGALTVAEDVRAILRRGAVLNGADVPANTVIVVVGGDLSLDDLQSEDDQ
ncbi:MAG: LytR C-terminal domain-containing protein [Thermoleophilia bacterium]